MSKRKTYRIVVEREPGWWIVSIPGVPGAHSNARRLVEVERNAREAIAVALDVDVDEFDIDIDVVAPAEVTRQLAESKVLLERATQTQKEAAGAARAAICHLTHDLGLTLREAGEVTGLSYQRVAQLNGPKREAS